MGTKVNRLRVVPRRLLESRAQLRAGFWTRLARSIMRRPLLYLAGAASLMLVLAGIATQLNLTGGDNRGIPLTTEATRGLALLERTLGPGALAPNQIVIDTGKPNGAWTKQSIDAQRRLVRDLRGDPEVEKRTIQAPALLLGAGNAPDPAVVAGARRVNLVDAQSR
jgi:uncharacterized membrane protein YdfJ with MMPL/SSD domain